MKIRRLSTAILRPNSRNKFFKTCLAEGIYREDGTHVGTIFYAMAIKPFTVYHIPEDEPERPDTSQEASGDEPEI